MRAGGFRGESAFDHHEQDPPQIRHLLYSIINTTVRYAHSNQDTKARAVANVLTSDRSYSGAKKAKNRDKQRCDSIHNMMESGKIEDGGMAEWLKAAVLKTVNGVTRSGVRIPLPPPDIKMTAVGA